MGPVTRIIGSFTDYTFRACYVITQEKLHCRRKLLHYRGLFSVVLALKCGCLIDFFAISLPTMRAYTHAHPCSLVKLNLLIDRFT